MPLYEFQCPKCGHRFERIQKFSDPDPKKCPECGAGKVERMLHAPAVQFKGSGWYVTDYGRRGGSAKSGEEKHGEPASKAESRSETKPESKPESKPEKPRK